MGEEGEKEVQVWTDTNDKPLTYDKFNVDRKRLEDSFAHPTNTDDINCVFMFSDWDGVWDDNSCDNGGNHVKHYACQYGE